jgi:nitrogen fixation NifU-like protein
MFSDAVLDHFRNPRNAGELANADAIVEATNPVCGDILKLFARLENDRIAEVRFLCRGCTTAIACASFATEKLRDMAPAEMSAITADFISRALGELPPTTRHGARLAADAVRALQREISRR